MFVPIKHLSYKRNMKKQCIPACQDVARIMNHESSASHGETVSHSSRSCAV